jgi:hypothetical protein
MDCLKTEQRLSEYLESGLPAEDMRQIAAHLESCGQCTALFNEMQSTLSLCQNYPSMEMDPDFLERILLRTSGRPRTRTFRERFDQYFLRSLLTPRFAAGAVLATLFVALAVNFMAPRLSIAFSDLSPSGLFQLLDTGVQQIYGEGLRAYERVNRWQAEFNAFKNSTPNKLRHMIEQIEGPVEGRKKPEAPIQEKGKSPKETSSRLLSWPA